MAKSSKTIRVFYSWQSDSPKKTNLNAIRNALKDARKQIASINPGLKIILDEATRDTSGSPNISLTILSKIEVADIFIADVTTVTPPESKRPCPNPNVGYELGYAVAQLGWDRIILLFNTEYGSFPNDLPFDFAQHRASPFKLALADPSSSRADLVRLLETAIDAVFRMNPKRPAELRGLSREKVEHDHDVRNMKWLMSQIHLPTLDEHIENLPKYLSNQSLWFHDNFMGLVRNSLFSIYDSTLKKAVDTLATAWNTTLSYDNEYHETSSGKTHVFTNPGDSLLPPDRQAAWDVIDAARQEMRQALDQILERLRSSYVEINIRKTNAKAWKLYLNSQKDVDDLINIAGTQRKRRKKK